MIVAAEGRIRLLRSVSARGERPPVSRPREDRETELIAVASENPDVDIEELVQEALRAGHVGLAAVTRSVLPYIAEAEHYRSIGRIAAIVAKFSTPRSALERPWVVVTNAVEIEDWAIEVAQGRRAR